MVKRKNLILIISTIVLYVINQHIKYRIRVDAIRWYMSCYFNDTIGGVTFMAYCNLIFNHYQKKMIKLWKIGFWMGGCGIFWEYITPVFRKNTISDPWDILAYICGGFLYWLFMRKEYQKENLVQIKKNKIKQSPNGKI